MPNALLKRAGSEEAMPYSEEVKQIAHELDPECWISYSGQPAALKRQLDLRRSKALCEAQRRAESEARMFDGMMDSAERFDYEKRAKEATYGTCSKCAMPFMDNPGLISSPCPNCGTWTQMFPNTPPPVAVPAPTAHECPGCEFIEGLKALLPTEPVADVPSGATELPELDVRESDAAWAKALCGGNPTALLTTREMQDALILRGLAEMHCRERQLLDYKAKYESALREIAELKGKL